MRVLAGFLWLALCCQVCAKPYSGRVKIAEETMIQSADRGLAYETKLDRAIDGRAADFAAFIQLYKKLDTSGAYFHFFHVYEAAERAGDKKFAQTLKLLEPDDLNALVQGLSEARGWLKRQQSFAAAFPATTSALKAAGKAIDF